MLQPTGSTVSTTRARSKLAPAAAAYHAHPALSAAGRVLSAAPRLRKARSDDADRPCK